MKNLHDLNIAFHRLAHRVKCLSCGLQAATHINVIVTDSSPLTISLVSAYYTYTGSGDSTWTLPPPSDGAAFEFTIINQGSGTLSIVSDSGESDIYSGSLINEFDIPPGEIFVFYSNTLTYTII